MKTDSVVTYLDCGCAVMRGGGRVWCPTCRAERPREPDDDAGKKEQEWARATMRELASRSDVAPARLRRWAVAAAWKAAQAVMARSWDDAQQDALLCADLLRKAADTEKRLEKEASAPGRIERVPPFAWRR